MYIYIYIYMYIYIYERPFFHQHSCNTVPSSEEDAQDRIRWRSLVELAGSNCYPNRIEQR